MQLTEQILREAAGWDVMKKARFYLEQDRVLSSHWAEPLLRGVVQDGDTAYRASMVIKSATDIENLCTCRDAREWGKICAHSVAVGLHWLGGQTRPATAREGTPPPAVAGSADGPTQGACAPRKRGDASGSLLRDPEGEAAELFVILPPNFEQAAARGKIMAVLEAKWSGGRCPLDALPKGRAFAFSTSDNVIIDKIEELAGGIHAIVQLDAKDFASLLPIMADHPNVTLGKSTALHISKTPLPLPMQATLEHNGEIVLMWKSPLRNAVGGTPTRATGTAALPGNKMAPPVMVGDWVCQGASLQPLGLPAALREVFHGPVRIPRAQVPQFLNRDWPQLQAGGVEANFVPEDFSLEPQAPRFLLELKGGLAQLSALLQCAYGPRIMTPGATAAGEGVWLPDPASPRRYSTRDFAAESAALTRLQRNGFIGPDAQGRMQLNGQGNVLNFFAREFPKLQREWSVTLEERLERSTTQQVERIQPEFRISSGVQWFDLGMVFSAGSGETFAAADIQRLLLSGQSHTRLKNGKWAVLDTGAVEELQEVLLDCAPQQHGQGYRINDAQAGFLEATLRQHKEWKVQAPTVWRDRAARQSGETKLECPPLGDLETVLRPYQKHGVAWLRFLRENGFGGILADEMGLGKTLQTLAFLRSRPPPRSLPHLVICPTSLVFNWLAEAKKFTPELKVLALHGPDRQGRFSQMPTTDIVLTSYALIRRDAERYREQEFDTVVLDEAQHIKNRQTQNAQAVKSVRSQHRLVLTGTPMENSVLDLWSIFDFLMPGYLGAARDFHERYEVPLAAGKNVEIQTRLSRRLRPFLLRRLKKEVAADLPAKLDQVSFCELTPGQRGVYQQLIEATRKEVLESPEPEKTGKNRMLVLSALLRLRQVCCDLRLLKLEGVAPDTSSSKLELFAELLEEALDGGHRVLVFSQFVSMLTLLREKLAAEGIEYCYLDGSTTDRGAVVEKFQAGAAPVFLISLKAGGTGLNLTAADTVIHFDPWWNPAVEDQATGRAHRIGQAKVVTSYKLIARDTVEEKILALQNRKRELIRATVGGEEEFTSSLTWEEIQELLV